MQKERLVLQMKPKYDKTKGQILILPSFNSFRRLDPQTRFYSDFIPTGTTTKGVDFTSDRLELLDLAYTFICTKQKLLPTHPSSSRERVLNILKRRFIKEKRNIQFVNPKYYSEYVDFCIPVYGSLFSHQIDQTSTRFIPRSTGKKSNIKEKRLEIGSTWLHLLKATQKQMIPQKLTDLVIKPYNHFPVSKFERYKKMGLKLPQKSPFLLKRIHQEHHCTLVPVTDPVLVNTPIDIYLEYPKIKNDSFCKVSFKWNAECRRIPNDTEISLEKLDDVPLKIDTAFGNIPIYIMPFSESKYITVLTNQIEFQKALFLEPIVVERPIWLYDIEAREAPLLAMDGEILSTTSFIIDFVAEKTKIAQEMGHSLIDTIQDIIQLGRSIGI